jgi:hypothetical protein
MPSAHFADRAALEQFVWAATRLGAPPRGHKGPDADRAHRAQARTLAAAGRAILTDPSAPFPAVLEYPAHLYPAFRRIVDGCQAALS